MELPNFDSTEIPVPVGDVRVRSIAVKPYPDGKRVRVELSLTPFQESPDIALFVRNSNVDMLASASIIGLTDHRSSLTMHLRDGEVTRENRLEAIVTFLDIGEVDRKEAIFHIQS
jgi:hypothetical protein